jgi:small subunit ribosomal protein S16
MLIIRLTRKGRRNDPNFRVVVTDHTNPVKGKFLEELGHYNPKLKTKAFKKERILYWISKGAKCSDTVYNLLVSGGIIKGAKIKAWKPKASLAGSKKKEGGAETPNEEKKEEVVEEAVKPAEEEKT